MKATTASTILSCILVLCIGCTPMPNDDTIYISGQYITLDGKGESIPFKHKVKCNMEVTYNSQVSYGQSTYRKTIPLYSEEDGSFEFKITNVGSYIAHLYSIYIDADTLSYFNDTIIKCNHGKPQTNILLPLGYRHSFNTKLSPEHIRPIDTLTLSINHDALTLVEIGLPKKGGDGYSLKRNDELLELDVLWKYEIDDKQSITFTLDNSKEIIPEQDNSIPLFIRYSTRSYGSYQIMFYLYRQ